MSDEMIEKAKAKRPELFYSKHPMNLSNICFQVGFETAMQYQEACGTCCHPKDDHFEDAVARYCCDGCNGYLTQYEQGIADERARVGEALEKARHMIAEKTFPLADIYENDLEDGAIGRLVIGVYEAALDALKQQLEGK
jgi:hypothetical protein